MNTDRKAILRVLAPDGAWAYMQASEIATACAIGRADADSCLEALARDGLVHANPAAHAKRAVIWGLTPKGRNHVETRMAA